MGMVGLVAPSHTMDSHLHCLARCPGSRTDAHDQLFETRCIHHRICQRLVACLAFVDASDIDCQTEAPEEAEGRADIDLRDWRNVSSFFFIAMVSLLTSFAAPH